MKRSDTWDATVLAVLASISLLVSFYIGNIDGTRLSLSISLFFGLMALIFAMVAVGEAICLAIRNLRHDRSEL